MKAMSNRTRLILRRARVIWEKAQHAQETGTKLDPAEIAALATAIGMLAAEELLGME